MTVPGNIDALLLGGQRGYQIERSLRFNSADSAYLSKTPTTPTNNLKWTFSCWVKRSTLGASSALFDAYLNGINFSTFYFTSTNELQFYNILGGVDTGVTTTGVYRDLSAWYHIVFVFDSANATAADRAIIYVNGTRPAQTNPYGAVTSSEGTYLNNPYAHSIGRMVDSGTYLNGYLTETYLIDGQALTPSSFGETDTITGVWKPKRYTGTYGTNGFYLKFADNSGTTSTTLGKDSSGNGNNWTPNNFSVTAGAGNDSLIDTPTPYADGGNGRGNYCTLNPLDVGSTSIALSNGNLDFTKSGANFSPSRGTLGVTTGKWYFEMTVNNSNLTQVGVSNDFNIRASGGNTSVSSTGGIGAAWDSRGFLYQTGSSGPGYGYTFTTNNVVMIAFDVASGKIWFGKNGTWNTGDPAAGTSPAFTASGYSALFPFVNGESGGGGTCNFGQRPFAYTPPSGFKALNTQNLPEPTIKKPNQWMDINLATGNNSTQTITNAGGFQPDLVWMKIRSASENHILYDSARGTDNFLVPNLTNAAASGGGQGLTSFNSNGFTLGNINPNYAGSPTFVAWQWKESATPGFDIVTYTGTGVARTIAHSLGVTPKMIIAKNRTSASSWDVYHIGLTSANYRVQLNSTGAESVSNGSWNGTAPTSTVFSVKDDTATNSSGASHVAYLWSEVAGFSKFGSYTGNGSSDGSFVFCGFRPKVVWFKRTDSTGSWFIEDSARGTYNAMGPELYANLSDAETTVTRLDFLSNGFKMRAANAGDNASGGTYIFCAWAESPFKYSLAR